MICLHLLSLINLTECPFANFIGLTLTSWNKTEQIYDVPIDMDMQSM